MKFSWAKIKNVLRLIFNGLVLLLTATVIFGATRSVMAQPIPHATAIILWFS